MVPFAGYARLNVKTAPHGEFWRKPTRTGTAAPTLPHSSESTVRSHLPTYPFPPNSES